MTCYLCVQEATTNTKKKLFNRTFIIRYTYRWDTKRGEGITIMFAKRRRRKVFNAMKHENTKQTMRERNFVEFFSFRSKEKCNSNVKIDDQLPFGERVRKKKVYSEEKEEIQEQLFGFIRGTLNAFYAVNTSSSFSRTHCGAEFIDSFLAFHNNVLILL